MSEGRGLEPHLVEIRHLLRVSLGSAYILELETFWFFIDLSLLGCSFSAVPRSEAQKSKVFNTLCSRIGIIFARMHRGTLPARFSLGLGSLKDVLFSGDTL